MLGITKALSRNHGGAAVFRLGQRWMVGKAANRAAVHGTKLPVPNAIPVSFFALQFYQLINPNFFIPLALELIIIIFLK